MTDSIVAETIRRRMAAAVLLAIAAFLAMCSNNSPLSAGTHLAIGTWGGDNVGVIASDTVTHVHFGCTFGDFSGNVALDATGHFAINGSYMLLAYPVSVGPSMPAQLSGQVVGNTLTFAIAVNDTVAKQVVSLGPGTVVYGKEPRMGPCPICAVPSQDLRKRAEIARRKD